VWADTVLHAEQQHLLRLLAWAALSILGGTGVATTLVIRRARSPLLVHFAAQMGLWGVVLAAVAAVEWNNARLRDLSSAVRLERLLWMNIGLDAGYVAVGATLGLTGWLIARRLGPVGAGIGVCVQGLALLVLHLQFASMISR
jgi:hypothetical protein